MDYGSLISSLVGLGTKVGTSIAGLKKVKRSDAGSRAARDAGVSLAQKAVGASQAGHGASRALALRSGLRSAAGITREAAGAQAQAAQRDEAIYQTQKQERNERVANFGGDLAKGLADMAATQIGPESQDAPGTAAVGMKANQPEAFDQATEAMQPAPEQAAFEGQLQSGDLGLDPSSLNADIQLAKAKAGESIEPEEDMGGPTAAFQVDPTTKLIESMPPSIAPELEQQLSDKLHMKELALAEAERLGIGLEVAIPRLNRRLGLRPGQSSQNPYGVSLNMGADDEGTE